MANSSKYDVLLGLYRQAASEVSLAADFKGDGTDLDSRKKLLRNHKLVSHLNYEVIRSISDLDINELQSELDCRNIKFEEFGKKIARTYNVSIQSIVIYGLLESWGIPLDYLSKNIAFLSFATKNINGNEFVDNGKAGVAIPITKQQLNELNSAYEIDMAKENITPAQQKILDESHAKFMAENVNPFISSKKLNEEDVVRLISLSK